MDGPRCIGRCGYEELTSHALLVGHGTDTTAKKRSGSIWQWLCVLDLGTCSRAEVVRGSHTVILRCDFKPIIQIFSFRGYSPIFRELLTSNLALTCAHLLKHGALTTTKHERRRSSTFRSAPMRPQCASRVAPSSPKSGKITSSGHNYHRRHHDGTRARPRRHCKPKSMHAIFSLTGMLPSFRKQKQDARPGAYPLLQTPPSVACAPPPPPPAASLPKVFKGLAPLATRGHSTHTAIDRHSSWIRHPYCTHVNPSSSSKRKPGRREEERVTLGDSGAGAVSLFLQTPIAACQLDYSCDSPRCTLSRCCSSDNSSAVSSRSDCFQYLNTTRVRPHNKKQSLSVLCADTRRGKITHL